MHGLRLRLLGRPRIELDGQALARRMPAKQQALVYYLAAEGAASRAQLAALLWAEADEEAARASLRAALMRLRRWLPGMLDADGQQLGWAAAAPVEVDLARLAQAAAGHGSHAERCAAAALWRGPLLDGFDVGSAEPFERWLAQARQRAERDALALRRALATAAEAAGHADEAVAHLHALLDIDDADEPAHMALMALLAAQGRRTAAIAQYETCRATLRDRLGARPSAACVALYARIHADAPAAAAVGTREPPEDLPQRAAPLAEAAGRADAAGRDPGPGAGLPARPGGALVGRDAELARLHERLLDPACRWLTVVGPGGVGKTRLAQAAAEAGAEAFRHGALWLSGRDPGAALRDPETLVQQVIAHTGPDRDRPGALLLVLDNLETVSAVPALARVLHERADGVTVLATARRRLGVAREWLLELDGLSLARRADDAPASSPAACLLAQAVGRLQPGFDPAAEAEAVERLCARVGGLPLALELAARGVHQAGVAAVLQRLDAGAPLADPDHDAEQRHHSIEVVLGDAWDALPAPVQAAALRLAWLPGAFDLELAQAAGAAADEVATLREHAWLTRREGALALHPLQQDYLRRHPLAAAQRGPVRQALAAHLRQWLPAVPPLGGWPGDAATAVALAASPSLAPALLDELLEPLLAETPAEPLAGWIDAAAALLRAAERADEAAALLARAAQRTDLPCWRRAGWGLMQGEIHNTLGDGLRAAALYEDALAMLGLQDPQRAGGLLPSLAAAIGAVSTLRGWPAPGALRDALAALVLRSVVQLAQLQSNSATPWQCLPSTVLGHALAARLGERAQGLAMRQMSAYGATLLFGQPRVAALLQRSLRRRPVLASDPQQEAFIVEGECATRIALGQWDGVDERLAAARPVFERHGDHRHAIECLSLRAKLRFYQGRLDEAWTLFAECSERSLRRAGGAWRAWGPFGQAETALCLGGYALPALQRLADAGGHWLTEMENVDAAYALRRLGLEARLAWRAGEIGRARDAALAGAAAAARIRRCGFWAHEGLAGIGEVLLALRRHERQIGGALPPLDAAWAGLEPALARHVRRFPAGTALATRLAGERRLDDGVAGSAALLQRAVAQAERQGLRVELARACEALARAPGGGRWGERAGRLWQEMGAAAAV